MKPAVYTISFESIYRGIIGLLFIIGVSYLLSSNKKAIKWKTVFSGLFLQFILGIGVIYVPFIYKIFELIGKVFIQIINFTQKGTEMLFGPLSNASTSGVIFAVQILPAIIFFSALVSVLYYLGIIQKVVKVLALFFQKIFLLSGAESLVAAANIFLGQSEAPLLVKSYLPRMTKSEIFLVMTAGMATLAGTVLAAYIGFLGGQDYQQKLLFAKHLIAASVMAAPGAIVISKIIMPQTESIEVSYQLEKNSTDSNILEAISNGTYSGLKLAVNVGAILIVFIAFIYMFNYLAFKAGQVTGINPSIKAATDGNFDGLSLQLILGYLFAPVMWIIGVCPADILQTGRLLGEKLILTEFVGYVSLANMKAAGAFVQQKSIIMAAYFLSGFANFASIGIQIACLGTLAPNKQSLISSLGIKTMIAGTLASLLSASFIGILIN